jgi:Recombination endonuclease VII
MAQGTEDPVPRKPIAPRICVICGGQYTPRTGSQKTCGPEHSRELRLQTVRSIQLRNYAPRSPRQPVPCQACGAEIQAPHTGPLPKWCAECRRAGEDQRMRARHRPDVRPCHRCGADVAGRKGKPGVTVCEACRVDKRQRDNIEHERSRRLRKYGLTETEYAAILERQDGRCAGCGTDDPGRKGWNIDHCHETQRVRAILCHRCNTAIGLCNEDPAWLRRLADLVTGFKQ